MADSNNLSSRIASGNLESIGVNKKGLVNKGLVTIISRTWELAEDRCSTEHYLSVVALSPFDSNATISRERFNGVEVIDIITRYLTNNGMYIEEGKPVVRFEGSSYPEVIGVYGDLYVPETHSE